MRPLVLILTGLLVFFQYQLWWGKNGYADLEKTRDKVETMKIENHTLMANNKIMSAQIKDLKAGSDAIEEQARAEYGMIKNNEVFYHIVKEK